MLVNGRETGKRDGMMKKRKKQGPLIATVQQARRLIKIVVGFTILFGGCVMLVTPGPGVAFGIGGLAILATEFVWARRLMKRVEREAVNMKNNFFHNTKNNKK